MSRAKSYGRQAPKNEAKPLGTKKGNKGRKPTAEERRKDFAVVAGKKVVDTQNDLEVTSLQPPITVAQSEPAPPEPQKEQHMTLTYKGLNKKGNAAIYSGAKTSVRFSLANFPGKTAPATIEVADGVFEAATAPKPTETKEERKARLAALPKPTEAERIARVEKNLAKRKAKLAAADASL